MSETGKFYYKNASRKIVLYPDPDVQAKAESRLTMLLERFSDNIPSVYKENWEDVKLYNPSGNIDNAMAIMLNVDEGAYDIRNKINDLTGKEWTKFTCSWFIFNALQSDLKEEIAVTKESQAHPATFSPTMVSDFINFFTKAGANVLDPFVGIGSTLVACRRTGRVGYGIELNPKYYEIAKLRAPEFSDNIYCGDSRHIKEFDLPTIDYSISSPPYWDMLNRSTAGYKQNREKRGLDVNYSDQEIDLGNITDYDAFIDEACKVYLDLYDLMRDGAYITVIVKNLKKGGQLYPLAWDMARKLGEKYVLKDERIWIQDKIGLSPYGYPFSWASNIIHHYCINLRKE